MSQLAGVRRAATNHIRRYGAMVMAASIAALSLWAVAATSAAFASGHVFAIDAAIAPASSTGTLLAPAVRLAPPVHVELAVPTPSSASNRSSCRSDLPGAAMTIAMASIAYSCPVYAGGQDMLDAGVVTMIGDSALTAALATHPGEPGTLWVAGHRQSHGGPFADVPTLAAGAVVTISDDTTTALYQVVGATRVELRNDRVVDASGTASGAATLDSILRPDHGANGAPRLLIQTCDGENVRWMVYADLVSSTPTPPNG